MSQPKITENRLVSVMISTNFWFITTALFNNTIWIPSKKERDLTVSTTYF
jgi:hypothetical protein